MKLRDAIRRLRRVPVTFRSKPSGALLRTVEAFGANQVTHVLDVPRGACPVSGNPLSGTLTLSYQPTDRVIEVVTLHAVLRWACSGGDAPPPKRRGARRVGCQGGFVGRWRSGRCHPRSRHPSRSSAPRGARVLIRVGLPENSGLLPRVAVGLGCPALVSAGRMWRQGRLRRPAPAIDGIPDLALDSAGFSAMKHHGGYPWTVADYVGIVALRRWAWWAQMDLCCEPEVAADPEAVRGRVEGSAALLRACREEAARVGAPEPMPVLQGWRPEDYARSAELIDTELGGRWPALVGVGSVCRRELLGPVGVFAVVAALDRLLPAGVTLHLFGQKGDALPELRESARVGSVDSCAWDDRARHALGDRRRELMKAEGITMKEANRRLRSSVVDRAAEMRAWWARANEERAPSRQPSLLWRAA